MTTTLDYNFRECLSALKGGSLHVLTALVLHQNERGRCWPSNDTLKRETGKGGGTITEALKHLEAIFAIVRVPHEHRIGDREKGLHQRKNIYQLTGVLVHEGQIFPYLYMTPETVKGVINSLEKLGKHPIIKCLEIKYLISEHEVYTGKEKDSTGNKVKDKQSEISCPAEPEDTAPENETDLTPPPTCPKCGSLNMKPFDIKGLVICADCRSTPPNPQSPSKDDCPLPSMCEHYDAKDGCQRPDWDGCRREGCVAPAPGVVEDSPQQATNKCEDMACSYFDADYVNGCRCNGGCYKIVPNSHVLAKDAPAPSVEEEMESKPVVENPPHKLTAHQIMFGAIRDALGRTVSDAGHDKKIGKAATRLLAFKDLQGNPAPALPEHIPAFFMWMSTQWWKKKEPYIIPEKWPEFVAAMDEKFGEIPVYPPEPEPMEFPTDLPPEQIEINKAKILAAIQEADNALNPNYVEPKTDE